MERKYKASWVASYIADHPDESGIVYCATRKEVESLAESLNIAVCELRAAKGEDATRLGRSRRLSWRYVGRNEGTGTT